MAERGDFTRKFDRDILGDTSAEEEEREVQRLRMRAEDQAVEAEFDKILSVLEYRAAWLRDRFPRCKEPPGVKFRGRRFEFHGDDGKVVGTIEFHVRLTDSQQGIMIESFMNLEGQFPRRHDYVNSPKENVNAARAKRFVESKIFEFAGPYQDAYGRAG